jgi:formyl-CoA transferase
VQFGRTPGPEPFAAPTLGQHTQAVLAAHKAADAAG